MNAKPEPPLSERDMINLLRLLRRFSTALERPEVAGQKFPPMERDTRVTTIINTVRTWARWYAEEELGFDMEKEK